MGLARVGLGSLGLLCAAALVGCTEDRRGFQGNAPPPGAATPGEASPAASDGADAPGDTEAQIVLEPVPQSFPDWCEDRYGRAVAATVAAVLSALDLDLGACGQVEERLQQRNGRLELDGSPLTDLRPIADLRSLRELTVEGDGSDRTLFGLASLRRARRLVVLRLPSMGIHDIDMEFLLQPWVDTDGVLFQALPDLTVLDLSRNRIRRLDYEWPSRLEKLLLHGNRIGNVDDRQADRVWRRLDSLQDLRILDLRLNRFGYLYQAVEDRIAHERLHDVLYHATQQNPCLLVQYTPVFDAASASLGVEAPEITIPPNGQSCP